MSLLGITGTNGAGKDSIGQMLAQRHGYLFISVTDILRAELKRREESVERENLRKLSAEWRRQNGLGILVDKAVEQFQASSGQYKGLAIASLRNPGEANRIHELGGKVVWVDADPKVRYERIHSRQRSSEDHKTFEQFLNEEQAEMQHEGDEATLSLAGVKAKADIFITNDHGDLKAFQDEVGKTLGL